MWRFLEQFRPIDTKALLTFQGSCVCCLTGVHPGFHSVAIGWVIKATWQASAWVRMVELWMLAACERLRKNNNNYMGDLGIEPRSQHSPSHVPNQLSYSSAFIIWMENSYYIRKININGINKKNAPDLNLPTTWCHAFSFFVCPAKYETSSGGFKPPQSKSPKNSD